LDFEKIVPIGDVPDWYERHIEKWGTKWNSVDCYFDETVKEREPLEIDFMTAWSPPIPIIKALAEKYHCSVRLSYFETGLAFRGIATAEWKDGEVQLDDCYRDMTDADFRELGLLPEPA
jgi:hypothetical protein